MSAAFLLDVCVTSHTKSTSAGHSDSCSGRHCVNKQLR